MVQSEGCPQVPKAHVYQANFSSDGQKARRGGVESFWKFAEEFTGSSNQKPEHTRTNCSLIYCKEIQIVYSTLETQI